MAQDNYIKLIPNDSSPKEDQNKPLPSFCPYWTKIQGSYTECLREGCTKYILMEDIISGENDHLDGICSDVVTANCLGSISLSLAVLAGQVELKFKDSDNNTSNEKLEGERLYG